MKVLAIVAQKGGTAKTTTAIALAVAAKDRGFKTAVLDLDPQTSACKWSDIRLEKTGMAEPAVTDGQPARIGRVIEAAKAAGVDLLVIDTAGRTEQAALAAARVADLVMVPVQASFVDLSTVEATMELITAAGNPPRTFLMTRTKTFGYRHLEAADGLRALGHDVVPPLLSERIAYQDMFASGMGPTEYEPKGQTAREANLIFDYVGEKLGLEGVIYGR